MRIYILGYMGSGKTTVGRRLANRLGYEFLDLDLLFEEKYQIGISEFFDKYGEDEFRELEHLLLKETFAQNNIVVATGGGTPCFFGNIDLINQKGFSIYLKMNVETLVNRQLNSKKPRPLLKSISENKLPSFIEKQLEDREPFYRKAHHSVEGLDVKIEDLMKAVQSKTK